MTEVAFDRTNEDLGNLVELGHVNYRIPDQGLATTFYVSGLGLTRDPFMMTGTSNMWVNIGNSQFHLPTGPAVVAPGIVTGLVVPDLDALRARLSKIAKDLAGTAFSVSDADGFVAVTCPWGNRLRCHAPDPVRFGSVRLGMAYVDLEVPRGTANGIARFYREIIGARAKLEEGRDGAIARITCGPGQSLLFTEKLSSADPCPQHHIQIYLADFSGPYDRLKKLGCTIRESSRHQYSFAQLRDPATGADLFGLDHETRSMTHPMFGRALINRDALQGIGGYKAGRDQFDWHL